MKKKQIDKKIRLIKTLYKHKYIGSEWKGFVEFLITNEKDLINSFEFLETHTKQKEYF